MIPSEGRSSWHNAREFYLERAHRFEQQFSQLENDQVCLENKTANTPGKGNSTTENSASSIVLTEANVPPRPLTLGAEVDQSLDETPTWFSPNNNLRLSPLHEVHILPRGKKRRSPDDDSENNNSIFFSPFPTPKIAPKSARRVLSEVIRVRSQG